MWAAPHPPNPSSSLFTPSHTSAGDPAAARGHLCNQYPGLAAAGSAGPSRQPLLRRQLGPELSAQGHLPGSAPSRAVLDADRPTAAEAGAGPCGPFAAGGCEVLASAGGCQGAAAGHRGQQPWATRGLEDPCGAAARGKAAAMHEQRWPGFLRCLHLYTCHHQTSQGLQLRLREKGNT